MRIKSSSAIEVSAVCPVIAAEARESAPPAATVALPLTSAKTASLTTLKSALFKVPPSEMRSSSVSTTSPVISAEPGISTERVLPDLARPSPAVICPAPLN